MHNYHMTDIKLFTLQDTSRHFELKWNFEPELKHNNLKNHKKIAKFFYQSLLRDPKGFEPPLPDPILGLY